MLERLLLVIALAAATYAACRFYRAWHARRVSARPADPLLAGLVSGVPAIVYFTTPHCMPCKTVQRPALAQVRQALGVQVVTVDATQHPDAAARWGVLSVPMTFVLDARGTTRHVNYGVTDADTLARQLRAG